MITPHNERARALSIVLADRLARGGKPPPYDADRVARSVIWTQRLAGIDARPHVETREPVIFP
jgi:hypothetical protein